MNSPRRGTPDFQLLFLTILLVCFGIAMIFSSSSVIAATSPDYNNDPWFFTKRQILFVSFGTIGMLITMNLRPHKLKKIILPFFLFSLFLMILVLIIGTSVNGAKRWIFIFGFGIQPAEFAKLALIMYLSVLISKKQERIRDFKKGLLPALIITSVIIFLNIMQLSLGTSIILLITAGTIILAGGSNLKHLFFLGVGFASVILLLLGIYAIFHSGEVDAVSVRSARLSVFLNPWDPNLDTSSFQIRQSLFALGHGGLMGTGFGESIQKLHYLPFPYNDFVFSIIGEEFGFIGTTIFLLVYVWFIWRGLLISIRSKDSFSMLVGIGIMSLFAIQAIINIGGITSLMPLTGVTLPFISYGGSSIIIMMVAMGVVLGISREQNRPVKTKTKG
ncbi:putative lipid II flippase FtsW [Paenibacillus larvae]|uniref:putative lipid II flippase FtsW n=1 Tax=Paenibacillus larvae TaxID=1464 RepID=UPI002854192E|nr:putative lipid II flippase FtsW [Paenibacillus larvae]MDR5584542.1 putative lipid II flippase FtsW [Paenibacillus larvae]